MSIWFFIWFLLSFLIIGVVAWSTIILVQQKKAWKAYAAKKGLTYIGRKFFEPCEVEGISDGYTISLFSATQMKEDARKSRQLSVLQVIVNRKIVDGIGAGTNEMLPFLQNLEPLSPHDASAYNWDKKFDFRSRNKRAVDQYLNEERVKVLQGLLSMPGADVIILMDHAQGIFRFETSNPLASIEKIETMVDKIIKRIQILETDESEVKRLVQLEDKKSDLEDEENIEVAKPKDKKSKSKPVKNETTKDEE